MFTVIAAHCARPKGSKPNILERVPEVARRDLQTTHKIIEEKTVRKNHT